MNTIIFTLKTAFVDFSRNKIRTLLTSLGILIGVASVVLLTAFGLGLKNYIKNRFESLGTNLIFVLPGNVLKGGMRPGGGMIGGVNFDEKDVKRLQRIKYAADVVPVFIKTITASAMGQSEIADLYATTANIFKVRNLEIDKGKVFTKSDVQRKNKVVVIGPKIAEKLYSIPNLALNRQIRIEKTGFKIIGILKPKGGGGFGGPDFDSFIYMPYKTAYLFNPSKTFFAIYLQAKTQSEIPLLKQQTKEILLRRYKEDDFSVKEQTEILNTVTSIFSILNSILVAIGAVSLIVGGVGIMNIMYVSVIERIKEIGIRRAVGATKKDILFQFLSESVILSIFGGVLGIAVSYIIVYFIQRFFPAYIDIKSIIIALSVSSIIGIVFGVLPAKKAADLSPIDAIRYE